MRFPAALCSAVAHAPLGCREFSTIAIKSSVCGEGGQDLCSVFTAEIINCAHRLDFSTGDGLHSVLEWAVVTSHFSQATVSGYLYSICNYMVRKIN